MTELKLNSKWIFYYTPIGRNSRVSVKNPEEYQNQL